MKRKKTVLAGVLVVLLAITMTVVLLKGGTRKNDSLETVRIGATSAVGGLVYVADEKGFFKQRGINPVIKTYEIGSVAINGLFNGDLDMVTAAEFMMVKKSFEHDTVRALAQIANTNRIELITRNDRGITKLSDLEGKKIGLVRRTNVEYFLSGFLKRSHIPFSSVRLVDLYPSAAEEAFYRGAVDAVVIWEPYVSRIEERLGKKAMRWRVQGRDDYYFLLITTEAFLRRSPVTAEKMLRALIDAEDFTYKHPEEAMKAIDGRLGFPINAVRKELARCTLKVRLDQGLLTLMEAEAQWMIRNGLTPKKEMPNFLDVIYLKALEAVKPEAVGIIH